SLTPSSTSSRRASTAPVLPVMPMAVRVAPGSGWGVRSSSRIRSSTRAIWSWEASDCMTTSMGVFRAARRTGGGLVLYPDPAFFHKFLILLPVSGGLVLWNVYRCRGLHVLLYPTGLLKFQRGEVESFPWGEIETVRLKTDQGSVEVVRDETGAVADCWVAVEA